MFTTKQRQAVPLIISGGFPQQYLWIFFSLVFTQLWSQEMANLHKLKNKDMPYLLCSVTCKCHQNVKMCYSKYSGLCVKSPVTCRQIHKKIDQVPQALYYIKSLGKNHNIWSRESLVYRLTLLVFICFHFYLLSHEFQKSGSTTAHLQEEQA